LKEVRELLLSYLVSMLVDVYCLGGKYVPIIAGRRLLKKDLCVAADLRGVMVGRKKYQMAYATIYGVYVERKLWRRL
jgi:hypothetical protein